MMERELFNTRSGNQALPEGMWAQCEAATPLNKKELV